jgi:hypothetical protein
MFQQSILTKLSVLSTIFRDSPLGRSQPGAWVGAESLEACEPIGYIIEVRRGFPVESFFSSFYSVPSVPNLGGELVAYETQLALFFRDTINIARIFDSFYDIRMQPRIRPKDILISVFLMPYWGIKALLQLDILLRTPQMLQLFRCPKKKKVVVSDTTIARVLNWLDPDDSRKALLAPLATLNKEGLLHRRLTLKGPTRRLGVIDESQMGDHYLVAALLCGQLNYPVLAEPCTGRGYEQTTTQKCLPIIHQTLDPAAPQLWLFDALYFNHTIFRIVGEQNAHLLIKYSPHENDEENKLFRDVLADAKRLFAANTPAIDPVDESQGFDSNRWCSLVHEENQRRVRRCSGEYLPPG